MAVAALAGPGLWAVLARCCRAAGLAAYSSVPAGSTGEGQQREGEGGGRLSGRSWLTFASEVLCSCYSGAAVRCLSLSVLNGGVMVCRGTCAVCLPKLGSSASSEPRWVQTCGTLLGRVVPARYSFPRLCGRLLCAGSRGQATGKGPWVLSDGEAQGTAGVKGVLIGNLCNRIRLV